VAGKPMPHILLVNEVRADWPAMCEVLGFRTWAHAAHPCFLCSCDKSGMCDLERRLEWTPFTPTDYLEEAAASTQEHTHTHRGVSTMFVANHTPHSHSTQTVRSCLFGMHPPVPMCVCSF
jgi:hypothetical protein